MIKIIKFSKINKKPVIIDPKGYNFEKYKDLIADQKKILPEANYRNSNKKDTRPTAIAEGS